MSIRFTMTAGIAMAIAATFAQPAHAEVTFKSQDGMLELTLPNGWHEAKGGAAAAIHVASQAVRITVREHPKEDFKDIKAVATFLSERLKKKLTDAAPKFEDIQVNGKPAIRVELEGTEPSGLRLGYVITVFDAGAMFVSIAGNGNASAFAKQKELLTGLANQLKVTQAGPPPTPAPPTPAPPPPATPKPPTSSKH